MKKALILPAFNEENFIEDVINRAKIYTDFIIVVDNCSTDKTFKKAKAAGALVLRHKVNLGKGASLKTGCEAAILLGAKIIAFMDSDGQHRPEELPQFFDVLKEPGIDMAIGFRTELIKMPWIRRFGTKVLMVLTYFLFNISAKDVQSGFRVFRRNIYRKIKPRSNNYYADAEITIRLGLEGIKFREIPIPTIYNDNYKGATIFDGIGLILNIIKWKITL